MWQDETDSSARATWQKTFCDLNWGKGLLFALKAKQQWHRTITLHRRQTQRFHKDWHNDTEETGCRQSEGTFPFRFSLPWISECITWKSDLSRIVLRWRRGGGWSASTLGYRFIDGLSVWHLGYKFHKVQAEKSSHRWPWEGNITLMSPFCLTTFLMIENPTWRLNKQTGTPPIRAGKVWFYEFDSFHFSHLTKRSRSARWGLRYPHERFQVILSKCLK